MNNVCYHIRAADALGFKAAILLTGHYGPNWQDLNTLTALLQPFVGTRLYSLPEFESNYKGFTNEYTSQDLIYLRARYYNPYLNQDSHSA